jgi:hypothetical protein
VYKNSTKLAERLYLAAKEGDNRMVFPLGYNKSKAYNEKMFIFFFLQTQINLYNNLCNIIVVIVAVKCQKLIFEKNVFL